MELIVARPESPRLLSSLMRLSVVLIPKVFIATAGIVITIMQYDYIHYNKIIVQ